MTHRADEDYCQRHQSQLHSPCCLPPRDQMVQVGGGPLSFVGQVDLSPVGTDDSSSPLCLCFTLSPPSSSGSLCVVHSGLCCEARGKTVVASPNKSKARKTFTLAPRLLADPPLKKGCGMEVTVVGVQPMKHWLDQQVRKGTCCWRTVCGQNHVCY